ncbi:ATP-binding protein [Thiocapsa sp.]|uniref:ATP-binding protein n=1 Tax=Thiocapsa sp. TaxID=2024551 RepID=UPI0035941FC4
MFDSIPKLLAKIRLGEDHFLELKEVRFAGGTIKGLDRKDLADELAAFANALGGVVVLGVHDKTREVLGIPLERLDAVEDFARECCIDSVKPAISPIIERMELPDSSGVPQPVLRVEVPKSLFVHQSPGGYLHRVGSAKRQMAPEYLARLFQQRSQTRIIRFDEQVVPQATIADLDEDLWRRFMGSGQQGEAADLLTKLGMARLGDDGVVRPTLAGVLMACPKVQRFVPNAFIQAVAYRGTGVGESGLAAYQRDARDCTGTLDQQIAAASAFVANNSHIAASKGRGRVDWPEYDSTAVFEAVVNAVAHRDYSIYGQKIRLRLFADRMELYSPGAIPNTMTVDSLPFRQFSRNGTLTSLLARCPVPGGVGAERSHIMDKRGEGVPLIMSRSAALSGREPVYRLLDESELLLTIPAATQHEPA